MRKPKKPTRICGDCLHVAACMAWNSGRLYDADATHCVNWQSAADVRPVVRGRWAETEMSGWDGDIAWICSACGEPWSLIDGTPADNNMNYCPNCGAKMEES